MFVFPELASFPFDRDLKCSIYGKMYAIFEEEYGSALFSCHLGSRLSQDANNNM